MDEVPIWPEEGNAESQMWGLQVVELFIDLYASGAFSLLIQCPGAWRWLQDDSSCYLILVRPPWHFM